MAKTEVKPAARQARERRQARRVMAERVRTVEPGGPGESGENDLPEDLDTGPAESLELGTSLSAYFRELANHDVLSATAELRAVREIEELEIELWERILSFAPAVDHVLGSLDGALGGGPAGLAPEFRSLRRAAARAAAPKTGPKTGTKTPATAQGRLAKLTRGTAERLRALDVDRQHQVRVIAELQRIARFAPRTLPATRVELRRYLQRVAEGQRAADEARNAFVRANLRLVVAIARRYRRDLLSFGDLIQEGNIGLMKGVGRFDHRRGVKFSTYASWWIRHSINRALADKGREVRVPVHMIEARHLVAKAERELESALGRPPSTEELTTATRMSAGKIERMRTVARDRSLSFDRHLGDKDEDRDLLEIFQDPNREPDSPADALAQNEMSDKVVGMMQDVLKPIELSVLQWRFGFVEDRELTLKEIGEKYDLSRERIRQIEAQALDKIRRALRQRNMV